MSETTTPRTDQAERDGSYRDMRAMQLKLSAAISDRDEARNERNFDPCISVCQNGHHFRTTPNTPAKSEREWECPHCAVIERDAALARVAELEKDKSRLDWLDKQKRELTGGWRGNIEEPSYWHNPSAVWEISRIFECGTYEIPDELTKLSLRAAIDSAMGKEGDAWLASHQYDSVRATSNPDNPNCYRK